MGIVITTSEAVVVIVRIAVVVGASIGDYVVSLAAVGIVEAVRCAFFNTSICESPF